MISLCIYVSLPHLKHLMAVMLEAMEPKKAAAVVREVTSIDKEAWFRV